MPNRTRFLICVNNDGYAASLEVRKLYPVVADKTAEGHSLVRVIDESGEDYLYPAMLFVAAELPQRVEKVISRVISEKPSQYSQRKAKRLA